MSENPRILVIGAGSIGTVHAQNAATLGQAAIIDQNADVAKEKADQLGVQSFGSSLEKALQWQPDGVVVAVPNRFHVPIAEQALAAGVPVMVEKPISMDLEDATRLVSFAKSRQLPLFVVSNMRFHPAVQVLRQNFTLIGKPLFARAHFGNYLPNMRPGVDYKKLYVADKDEGGVVLDGIHELDYLSWLLGPIERSIGAAAQLGDLEIEAEDYASMVFWHRDNVKSELHLDFLRPHKRRGCEIVGSKAILDWESSGKNPEHCLVRLFANQQEIILLDTDNLDFAAPLRILMQNFINAISGHHHDLQSGEEGLRLLKTALRSRGLGLNE